MLRKLFGIGPKKPERDRTRRTDLDDLQDVLGLTADYETRLRIKGLLEDPRSDLRLFLEASDASTRRMLPIDQHEIPPDSWEVATAFAEREGDSQPTEDRIQQIHRDLFGTDYPPPEERVVR